MLKITLQLVFFLLFSVTTAFANSTANQESSLAANKCNLDDSCNLKGKIYTRFKQYIIVPENKILGKKQQGTVLNIGEQDYSLIAYPLFFSKNIPQTANLKNIKCDSTNYCYILYNDKKRSYLVVVDITHLLGTAGADYTATVKHYPKVYNNIKILWDNDNQTSSEITGVFPVQLY